MIANNLKRTKKEKEDIISIVYFGLRQRYIECFPFIYSVDVHAYLR